ncbi:MAG: hypothetical protein AAF702_08090 [Chloroflexota bacterium]
MGYASSRPTEPDRSCLGTGRPYYASQDGGLKQLLQAALAANPNNAPLLSLSTEWADIDFAIRPLPSATSNQIPLQRPEPVEHFQDRKTELAQLLDDLQPGQVATLCGPGGMGKTALASKAIWQLAPGNDPPARFPDGILFHSFYNQPGADAALEHIARSYGMELDGPAQAAAQRALSGRTALLVLGGTEEADDLPKVLTIRNRCGVLVTSRKVSDAPGDHQDLNPLPTEDAQVLLNE